jgi:hypothetical protein
MYERRHVRLPGGALPVSTNSSCWPKDDANALVHAQRIPGLLLVIWSCWVRCGLGAEVQCHIASAQRSVCIGQRALGRNKNDDGKASKSNDVALELWAVLPAFQIWSRRREPAKAEPAASVGTALHSWLWPASGS